MGFDNGKADVNALMQKYAASSVCISFAEYMAMRGEPILQVSEEAKTAWLFQQFSVHDNSVITVESLAQLAEKLGIQQVNESEIAGMIQEFDADQVGCINAHEFRSIMNLA